MNNEELSIIPTRVIRRAVDATMSQEDAFVALHAVNPELAILANADRHGLLNSKLMPYIAHFRTMQKDERVALIGAMTRRYEADTTVRVEETRQGGMTRRAGLEVEVRKYEADTNLMAVDRDARSREAVASLQYEAQKKMVEDYVGGQKYISDNQFKASKIESETRLKGIIATEEIRAELARDISRDRVEAMIKVAAIDFAKGIQQAEIIRAGKADKQRGKIATAYIGAQTQLMLGYMAATTSRALSKDRLEGIKLEVEGRIVERGLDVISRGVERGDPNPQLKIRGPNGEIEIRYKGKDDQENKA